MHAQKTELHSKRSSLINHSFMQINDRVGIIRVPEFNGSLIIYINGAPIGIIATSVPDRVYGFVELQGECERVALTRNRLVKHVSACYNCYCIDITNT